MYLFLLGLHRFYRCRRHFSHLLFSPTNYTHMRCLITLFAVVVLSSTAFAQKVPFGTYYFMPKTPNSESREYQVREFKFSPSKISEQYTDAKLNPVKGHDAFASESVIDTIIRRNGLFYFVFPRKEKYGPDYLHEREGYAFSVLRTAVKGKYNVIEMRANNYTHFYYTKQEVLDAIRRDSLPFFHMTYFPKAALLKFATLKPVDSIDINSYKKLLQKMADTRKEERKYYKTIPYEAVQQYAVSRFFTMSYRYFFAEAGFTPFLNGDDLEKLSEKYKYDVEVRNLYDDAW
jgi:hypothetical protein